MSKLENITATGHCYCGKVKFATNTVKANRSMFCHCENCRRSHSAPVYHASYVNADSVDIFEGKELLKGFSTCPEFLMRYFCSECGTRIYNSLQLEDQPLWFGLFPDTFDLEFQNSEIFSPEQHVNCASARILNLFDPAKPMKMPNRDD